MKFSHRTIAFACLLAALTGCNVADTSGRGVGDQADAAAEEPDLRPAEERALEDRLYDIGSGFDGFLGMAVVDIAREREVSYNGSEWFPQQSVSKLWVAIAALDAVDRGKLDLSEQATVRYPDLTVFHQPIRKLVVANGSFTASYDEFLRRALTESDNTANSMALVRVGGPKAIRSMFESKQLAGIRFGPGERLMQSEIAAMEWDQSYSLGKTFFEARKLVPDDKRKAAFDAYVTDPVDGAQPASIAMALARLARGELLSGESTTLLLGWLADAKSGPNRLKGGLPEGWSIAHKTGTGQVLDTVPPGVIGEQAGYNDIAILTAPDGSRYAVVVMIGRTKRPVPERMEMMHAVVGAVEDYHYAALGQPKPTPKPAQAPAPGETP